MAVVLHQYATSALVLTTALVLLVGVVAQLIAKRVELPAILFLLGFGIALGPYGLGWIQPTMFGEGLRAVVSISVAVIVFQGAMAIDLRHLSHTSRSVLSLVSVGALTTLGLAAVAVHYLVGYPWLIALLFGAIVCVTGPTVIGPILARLPLPRRLKTVLEAESVLVDAIGVLLTAAVFSYITGSTGGAFGGLVQLGTNLAIGVGLGLGMGGGLALVLRREHTWPSQHVRLLVLAVALLCYALAESLAHESGIAAVATAGLVFGSVKIPYEETIKQFKGDLVQIALSLVFVLLAASVDLSRFRHFGWGELAVVLLLMFVVRPIAVGLATLGSAMSWREKAFVAWMGPRGVVATAMASLMSFELKAWEIHGADGLPGLVFLLVVLSVLIEGSGAGFVAARLKLMPKKVLVVGGDEIARKLALQLREEDEHVVLIDRDPVEVREALEVGLEAMQGDATLPEILEEAGAGWSHTLVAATASDKTNLIVCQAVRAEYPRLRLVARLNENKNAARFEELGIEMLSTVDATALTLTTLITRPTMLPLLKGSAYGDVIAEVAIGNPRIARVPLKQLNLPKECLIALVKRGGRVSVPDGKTTLEPGDNVTLIGLKQAVEQTRLLLESNA